LEAFVRKVLECSTAADRNEWTDLVKAVVERQAARVFYKKANHL